MYILFVRIYGNRYFLRLDESRPRAYTYEGLMDNATLFDTYGEATGAAKILYTITPIEISYEENIEKRLTESC